MADVVIRKFDIGWVSRGARVVICVGDDGDARQKIAPALRRAGSVFVGELKEVGPAERDSADLVFFLPSSRQQTTLFHSMFACPMPLTLFLHASDKMGGCLWVFARERRELFWM